MTQWQKHDPPLFWRVSSPHLWRLLANFPIRQRNSSHASQTWWHNTVIRRCTALPHLEPHVFVSLRNKKTQDTPNRKRPFSSLSFLSSLPWLGPPPFSSFGSPFIPLGAFSRYELRFSHLLTLPLPRSTHLLSFTSLSVSSPYFNRASTPFHFHKSPQYFRNSLPRRGKNDYFLMVSLASASDHHDGLLSGR